MIAFHGSYTSDVQRHLRNCHPPPPLKQAEEKKTVAMAQHEILTHFRGYGFGLTDNRAAHVGH
jgi:hypothetical protein